MCIIVFGGTNTFNIHLRRAAEPLEPPGTQRAANATGKTVRVFHSLKPIKLSDITESGGKIFKPLPEEIDSAKDGSFVIPLNGYMTFKMDQALHVILYSIDPDDTSTCKPENKLMDSIQLSPDQSYIFTKSGCVVAKPGELWVDEEGRWSTLRSLAGQQRDLRHRAGQLGKPPGQGQAVEPPHEPGSSAK
ncbi:hypothetical protein GJAV_G00274150 [Gymnothorax javanicus]|nr:hypothetical protein GJAV_G00274150 [Gymnothorax javanicus]